MGSCCRLCDKRAQGFHRAINKPACTTPKPSISTNSGFWQCSQGMWMAEVRLPVRINRKWKTSRARHTFPWKTSRSRQTTQIGKPYVAGSREQHNAGQVYRILDRSRDIPETVGCYTILQLQHPHDTQTTKHSMASQDAHDKWNTESDCEVCQCAISAHSARNVDVQTTSLRAHRNELQSQGPSEEKKTKRKTGIPFWRSNCTARTLWHIVEYIVLTVLWPGWAPRTIKVEKLV
jgi:hypothetical protein